MTWFWVFLGGGLGSLCRYGIARGLAKFDWTFPAATLTANFLSCVLIGFLMGISLHQSVGQWRWFAMIGFCGGFSTFSTFTAEQYNLWQTGQYTIVLVYILSSIVLCLLALVLGIKMSGA